jgi:hypothetical protein
MNSVKLIVVLTNILQILSLNYCKNCKYYKMSNQNGVLSEICLESLEYNNPLQVFDKCDVVRSSEDKCGKLGRFYEPIFNDNNNNNDFDESGSFDENYYENIELLQSLIADGILDDEDFMINSYRFTLEDMQLLNEVDKIEH